MRNFPNSKTSLAFGQENLVPGDQVVSLVIISTSLEKIPLNPLHSVRKLNQNPKETEGIGGEVLENRDNQSAFACLTEGGPFPASEFLVEVINDACPKGVWGFGFERKPKISRR